ncbi:MAG: tetratricopeptide repeat protein [Gemmatimonadetes bacterium]|nr:MAG: tetratricopeptide repeat protein [Gemmatimonadota bacterium]
MADAEKIIRKALRFKENKQFDKATETLRDFLKDHGHHFDVLWELAAIYFESGREKSGVTTLRQVLKSYPSKIQAVSAFLEREWKHARDPESLLWFLWENQIHQRDFDEANRVLERLDTPAIQEQLTHYRENLRHIEEYKDPTNYDDNDIDTFYYLAELQRHLGQTEEALISIRKLIDLRPAETQNIKQIYEKEYHRNREDEHTKSILGEIYMMTDDIESAVEVFLEIPDKDANRLQDAVHLLEKMLLDKPDNPELLKGMAKIHLKLDNISGGLEYLVRAAMIAPEAGEEVLLELDKLNGDHEVGVLYARGQIYQLQGKYQAAIDAYQTVLERDPAYEAEVLAKLAEIADQDNQNLNALLNMSELEIQRGEFSKALRWLDKARRLRPDEMDEIIRQLLKILQVDESHLEAHRRLGDIYTDQGDYERAVATYLHLAETNPAEECRAVVIKGLETIHTKKPSHTTVSLELGKLYIRQKNYQEAIMRLSDVLKYAPDQLNAVMPLITEILNKDRKQASIVARMYESVALKTGIDDTLVALALAKAYVYERQYERATQQLERVLALDESYTDAVVPVYQQILDENPSHHESRLALADLYMRQGQYPAAVDVLRAAARHNQSSSQIIELFYRILDREDSDYTRQALIETLHERKLTDLTIQECEKVIQKSPEAAYAYEILADALIEKGHFTQSVDRMYALMAMDASTVDVVLEKCDRILSIDETNVAARYCRAEAFIKKDRLADAVDEFMRVLKYDSDRIEAVIDHLKRVISLQHTNVDAHLALGEVYLQKNDYNEASRAFSTALELDSDRLGEVIRKYYQILKLDPVNVTAHFMLGKALIKKEEYAKAVEHLDMALELDYQFMEPVMREYQRALEQDASVPQTHLALGQIYAQKNLYSSAIEHFTKTLELDASLATQVIDQYQAILLKSPAQAKVRFALGNAYIVDQDYPAAIEQIETALKTDEKLLPQAIEAYESILVRDQQNARALLALAKGYVQQGNFENAATHLVQVADLDPNQTEAIIEGLEMILDADPSQVTSRLYLGDMYSRKGAYSNALEEFHKALDQTEDVHQRVELYLHIGNTYVALQDDARARQAFLSARELEPENSTLYQQLRELYSKRTVTQIQLLRKQLEAMPTDPATRLELIRRLREAHQYDEAIQVAQFKGIDASTEAQRLLELGRCFLERGDYYTAIEVLSGVPVEGAYLDRTALARLYYQAIAYERVGLYQHAISLLEHIQRVDMAYADVPDRIQHNFLQHAKGHVKTVDYSIQIIPATIP